MTIFTELVNETGFDPFSPCPVDMSYDAEPWYPRNAQSVMTFIAGQLGTTPTAWTRQQARELRELTAAPEVLALPAAPVDLEEVQKARNIMALRMVRDWKTKGRVTDDAVGVDLTPAVTRRRRGKNVSG
jgi:hypothetical protein